MIINLISGPHNDYTALMYFLRTDPFYAVYERKSHARIREGTGVAEHVIR